MYLKQIPKGNEGRDHAHVQQNTRPGGKNKLGPFEDEREAKCHKGESRRDGFGEISRVLSDDRPLESLSSKV